MNPSYRLAKVFIIIALIAVAIGLVLFIGMSIGKKQGLGKAETELGYAVKLAYPAPASEIKILSGIVKGVYGGTINIEVVNPNDYLPHPDGSAPQKEIRYAKVTSATKIILNDVQKLDQNGNASETIINISAIRAGDAITVKSEANIKDAKSFEATEIEVVRY